MPKGFILPPQPATRDGLGQKRGNTYLFAGARLAAQRSCSLGRERGSWDMVEHGGKWDGTVGVDASVDRTQFSLAYVGSSAEEDGLVVAFSLGL